MIKEETQARKHS